MLDMHLEHFVPSGRQWRGLQRPGRLLPRRVCLRVRALYMRIDDTLGTYKVNTHWEDHDLDPLDHIDLAFAAMRCCTYRFQSANMYHV